MVDTERNGEVSLSGFNGGLKPQRPFIVVPLVVPLYWDAKKLPMDMYI